MIRGYARVSTEDQDLGRQIVALKGGGAEVIYQDKVSGCRRHREALDRMMMELEAGDVVIIQKLDRLGRSLKDLIGLIEIFKSKGVGFKSLGDPIDTTTAAGMFIFQIVGAVAEFERALISERIKDGMRHRKSLGVVMGRPLRDRAEMALGVSKLIDQGKKRDAIIGELGISRGQFYKALKWVNLDQSKPTI